MRRSKTITDPVRLTGVVLTARDFCSVLYVLLPVVVFVTSLTAVKTVLFEGNWIVVAARAGAGCIGAIDAVVT